MILNTLKLQKVTYDVVKITPPKIRNRNVITKIFHFQAPSLVKIWLRPCFGANFLFPKNVTQFVRRHCTLLHIYIKFTTNTEIHVKHKKSFFTSIILPRIEKQKTIY